MKCIIMTEFNITGLLTQSYAGLTFTGGFTWVIFKSIKKNPFKDKYKLDLLKKKKILSSTSYNFSHD